MGSNGHKKNLVVLQLSGGNDYLNTVIPYNDGNYLDYRKTVRIDPGEGAAPGRPARLQPGYGAHQVALG